MTDFADALEADIIDWVFDGTQFPTPPSDVYVGLHTGAPGDDGASNEISTNSTGYSRTAVPTGSGWNQPSANEASNAGEVAFGPADTDWGDVSHFTVWDSQTGGNCLWTADLGTTRTILTDDEARFAAGELTFTVD
jgi:hypothetical protein